MPAKSTGGTKSKTTKKKATKTAKKATAKKATTKTATKTTTKKATATKPAAAKKPAAPAKTAPTKVRVKQIRSTIGRRRDFGQTLRALGIRHHQQEVVVTRNAAIDGMLTKVSHLVRVTPEE